MLGWFGQRRMSLRPGPNLAIVRSILAISKVKKSEVIYVVFKNVLLRFLMVEAAQVTVRSQRE